MKLCVTVWLCILISICSIAQSSYAHLKEPVSYYNPDINGESLQTYILKEFYKERSLLSKSEINGKDGICWIKFKIDEKGKLIDLDFSMGTPETLNKLLLKWIEETYGKWLPKVVDGKAVVSEILILPVYFNFRRLADKGSVTTESVEIYRFFNKWEQSELVRFLPGVNLDSGYVCY